VREGLFGVRSGERVYCKEAVPDSVLEYGAVLLREAPMPPAPPPPPPLPGHIAVEEILHCLGTAESLPLQDVYAHLWKARGGEFPSEESFREVFQEALRNGCDAGLLDKEAAFVRDRVDWQTLMRTARITRLTAPPPPPPPTAHTYSLRARIPWDKLSDFVRGVVNPLRQDGAELEVEVSLRAQSQPGGFKKSTLEQKVRETLQQIGAEIREEREV